MQTLPWGNNTATLVPLVTQTVLSGALESRKKLQQTTSCENPPHTAPSSKGQGKPTETLCGGFEEIVLFTCSVLLKDLNKRLISCLGKHIVRRILTS